jgi:glycosyltransferase involved in cell wall biosynthesis
MPLITKADWKLWERRGYLEILRLPWLPGLFYKFVGRPVLEFLYLVFGLFLVCPFVIFWQNPDVIHSHGLVAGFVAVFWGKIFGKRVITTTHSVYNFPKKGLYRNFAMWIFGGSDRVLCLSKQSKKEIESLGINPEKVKTFTYWVDLSKFKVQDSKSDSKKKVGWSGYKFVVLFVGRLVEEKGILVLLQATKKWNRDIVLVIAGTGPLEKTIEDSKSEISNLVYLGKIDNDMLPLYYSAADIVIVPSIHEEGFGRVILESLACGTPVIAANRGAIPEAMNETVGKLINVSPESIKKEVESFYKNSSKISELAKNARLFSEERYSERNVEEIIRSYVE